jgi:hypothetical protein
LYTIKNEAIYLVGVVTNTHSFNHTVLFSEVWIGELSLDSSNWDLKDLLKNVSLR